MTIALSGLIVRIWSDEVGLVLLASGMVVYLVGVVTIFIGYWLIQRVLAPPRPKFWHFQWMLVADAIRPSRPQRARY